MISDRHKCIFVHIPRCAGTSIEDLIWPGERRETDLWMGFVDRYRNRYQTGGLQHLLARQIREEVGDERFASYFKFAIVRNPFDRAVSQFAYMQHRPDLRAFIGMRDDSSFMEYIDLIRRKSHVQWEPQYSFIDDGTGALLVDVVVRFEALEREMQHVLARLGLGEERIPHRNATARAPYSHFYSPETQALVEEMYRIDLDRLGYVY